MPRTGSRDLVTDHDTIDDIQQIFPSSKSFDRANSLILSCRWWAFVPSESWVPSSMVGSLAEVLLSVIILESFMTYTPQHLSTAVQKMTNVC